MIEYCSYGESCDIGSNRSYCEHEIQVYLLVVACSYTSFQLVFRAVIPIYMFADKDWFESSIAKDDTGCEEAVED